MASSVTESVPAENTDRKLSGVVTVVLAISVGVVAALIAYAALAADKDRWGAGLGALVVAAAAAGVGTLIGFLFGVPESVRELRASGAIAEPGAPPTTTATDAVPSSRVTQLVQIADWLTKVLIGATITQLGAVPDHLQRLGETASLSLLGHDGGGTPLAAAITYFATFGFFSGYLSTRLVLNLAFNDADRNAIRLPTELRETVMAAQDASTRASSPGLEIPAGAAKQLEVIDGRRLTSAEDLLAWGLGRAAVDRGDRGALSALKRARDLEPTDRRTIEGLAYASLYAEPPAGFRTAITEAKRFLDRRPTLTRDDATLLAYLACGYGQAFAWEQRDGKRPLVLETYRREAVEAVRRALALDPSWKAHLAALAETGGRDDDLAAVAAVEPVLRHLLDLPALPTPPG